MDKKESGLTDRTMGAYDGAEACEHGDGHNRGFLKIGVPLGCLYYFHTKVCSQMTFNGDLYHVGPSKLICATNWWTGPCMMQFLQEGSGSKFGNKNSFAKKKRA